MTRALVLGRLRKGRPIADTVAEAVALLEGGGWSVSSSVVERKRELRRATKHAVADGVDAVVAVGGDGAVLQVIQRLVGSKVALGIVPMGTGNLLATNLGIPTSLADAVGVLLGERQRVIDVGEAKVAKGGGGKGGGGKGGGKRATKRFFSVACGIGFDAEVMQATAKSRKRRLGKLAYLAAAVGQRAKLRNEQHEITIDGVARTGLATQVFVANFGKMGLPLEPQLEIVPDDGQFDVIIVRAAGAVEGLVAGWAAIRQRRRGHASKGRVFRATAREARIAADRPRLVELDGSVIGTTPVDVSIRPAALSVIVPAEE